MMLLLSVLVGRGAEILVRGAVRLLGLLVLLVAFVPVAPALLLWPWLPESRLRWLLELYRGWAVTIIGPHDIRPDADRGELPPAETLDDIG